MYIKLCALLAAGAFACLAVTPAVADAVPTTICTTNDKGGEPPSGSYVDANGRKWAGFKPDGTPPDSLTANYGETTCVTQAAT